MFALKATSGKLENRHTDHYIKWDLEDDNMVIKCYEINFSR